jgi:hypothetical protein
MYNVQCTIIMHCVYGMIRYGRPPTVIVSRVDLVLLIDCVVCDVTYSRFKISSWYILYVVLRTKIFRSFLMQNKDRTHFQRNSPRSPPLIIDHGDIYGLKRRTMMRILLDDSYDDRLMVLFEREESIEALARNRFISLLTRCFFTS